VYCAIVDTLNPPEKPGSPQDENLQNTKGKRSLDFTAVSDSIEKTVTASLSCEQCPLNNSFVVPLEESFTESTEVESLKRNLCLSDSSPDDSKYTIQFLIYRIIVSRDLTLHSFRITQHDLYSKL